MWEKSYSTTVNDITQEQIWNIWSDMSIRHQWDDDTEWAKMDGPFRENAIFYMKVKNGPKLKMVITECKPYEKFSDTYYFPLARMDGIHQMEQTTDGLRITVTIRLTGLFQWLWRKLVAEKIVSTLSHQTDLLIQLARKSGTL